MGRTVRQLMDQQAVGVIGRDVEPAVLRQLLGERGPLVVFVQGSPGSARPRWSRRSPSRRGPRATVLRLDCRSIEPTERGFLARSRRGPAASWRPPATLPRGSASLGKRVVLMLDTYELFRILDPWLRQTFVPALTDNVRVVLSPGGSPR